MDKKRSFKIVLSILLSLCSIAVPVSGIELMGQSPEGLTKIARGFPIEFLEYYLLPSESWSYLDTFRRFGQGSFYLKYSCLQ